MVEESKKEKLIEFCEDYFEPFSYFSIVHLIGIIFFTWLNGYLFFAYFLIFFIGALIPSLLTSKFTDWIDTILYVFSMFFIFYQFIERNISIDAFCVYAAVIVGVYLIITLVLHHFDLFSLLISDTFGSFKVFLIVLGILPIILIGAIEKHQKDNPPPTITFNPPMGNCTFDGTWTCSNCSDVYELSAHNIYSLISGTGKTNTQIKFPNVPIQVSDEDYFDEPPNKAVGEFTTMEIVEITENYFYLKYSYYDNDYPDAHMDFEIVEYEIKKGSLKDYQNGKEIILNLTENGKLAELRNLEIEKKATLESTQEIKDASLKDKDQMLDYIILLDKNRLVVDFGGIRSYEYSGHLSETFCAEFYE